MSKGISIKQAQKELVERKKYKEYKSIPIDPDKLKEIQIKVGRRKKDNEKGY